MTVPVEDAIFVVCSLVGVALLLGVVAFDETLGGVLDAMHLDAESGRSSWLPPLVAFVLVFGVGGLAVTQLLDLHGGAAIVGAIAAAVGGALVAYAAMKVLRRTETQAPPSIRDLVGADASVVVAIPAGRFGSVRVRTEGRNHEYSATAAIDIARDARVTVTAALGNGLVVAPIDAPSTPVLLEKTDREA